MYQRAKYLHDTHTDWRTIPDPVATVKYDGGSYFIKIEPDGSLRYYSRRPSVRGGFPDRTEQLPHLTQTKLPQFAGNVYNVELIHTGFDKKNVESHRAVSGILNSLPARSIHTQNETGPVRAALFDVVEPKLPTYEHKIAHLKTVEQAFGKSDLLFVPEVHFGHKAIHALIERTKKQGREGVIITSASTPEVSNSRVKIKHRILHDLRIVGIKQEYDIKGNPKPSMGAVEVADATGRIVADVGTGWNAATRKEVWEQPKKWLGELIQVESLGLSKPGGRLRHPVYSGIADSAGPDIVE